jgi:Na+-transporting NADH:ubiquinone oxidoreductase subunit F
MDYITLIIAAIVFLVITVVLVALLLFVKAKLTPSGTVTIDINSGDTQLEVTPGSSLLATLANEKIFLPSACGGGGTCGMCKCQVLSGAGTILPTEVGFFTRKQQQNNWRLGCQVKVRENLEILLPQSVLGIKKWECEVVSNRNVATFIKEFVVRLPAGENLNFRSGGYIQIDIPKYSIDYSQIEVDSDYRKDWERNKFFDLHAENTEPTFRAYSMANHPAEGNIIMLNVRIATPPFDRTKGCLMNVNPGISSSYIFSRKPGDKVTISGPYGEFFLKDTDNEIIFVGGGAGMAPMRSHIFHLFKTLKSNRKVSFWYGARSLKENFYENDFEEIQREFPNFTYHLVLSDPQPEDNWKGLTGFVHQALFDNYLKMHETPEDVEYYLCGPPMMTSSVVKMLDNLGVPTENVMFDNFGA